MTKKNQQILGLVLLFVGGYYILKRIRPSSNRPSVQTGGGTNLGSKYVVATSSSSLNVRSQPNTSSPVVSKLPKGAEFNGTPALANPNWIVVYNPSGRGILGYVSASFVRLK